MYQDQTNRADAKVLDKNSAIHSGRARIDEQIAVLLSNLEMLEQGLQDALSPATPAMQGPPSILGPIATPAGPLASNLMDMAQRLESANTRLGRVISRLEL